MSYEKRIIREQARLSGTSTLPETPSGNVTLAVMSCKDAENIAMTMAKQIDNVGRVGYIDGDIRGFCEIYFEMPNYEEARKLAYRIHGATIPDPIRGVHMVDENFDDILNDDTFKLMGGKELEL